MFAQTRKGRRRTLSTTYPPSGEASEGAPSSRKVAPAAALLPDGYSCRRPWLWVRMNRCMPIPSRLRHCRNSWLSLSPGTDRSAECLCRWRAGDFLRPASVRLEHGKRDPQAYRSGWLDVAALQREVLEPFRTSGRYLPSLWDEARDRATRATAVDTPAGAVLLVDGTLLLDKGLRFDLTVHLSLTRAALVRQTSAHLQWTLPAYEGYPGAARPDVVVRWTTRGTLQWYAASRCRPPPPPPPPSLQLAPSLQPPEYPPEWWPYPSPGFMCDVELRRSPSMIAPARRRVAGLGFRLFLTAF